MYSMGRGRNTPRVHAPWLEVTGFGPSGRERGIHFGTEGGKEDAELFNRCFGNGVRL